MSNISKKVAFITGGSKGIGLGIALSLAAEGVFVAITSRSMKSATEAANQINAKYPKQALGLEADVRNLDSQTKAVNKTIELWGRLDVMIANAGVGHFASIEDLTPEQWSETIDTNLTGVFNSVKAALEPLKKSKGYLITIASLAGTNFFATGSAYNASKFGLVGFTQAAMLDLRKYGIKTTTLMPGSVATFFNGHTPNDQDGWKIQPEDMGQIVVDLLKMPARALPSKVEIRPTTPPSK